MECLTDYDVLNSSSDLSSSFLVKHKPTGHLYCLKSISCADFSDSEQKALMKKIKLRINVTHPNILNFHGHIQHKDILYLKQEYCAHGTLSCFIQKECVEKNRQLHEAFISRILYQTVFALKTVEFFMGPLSLDTVLLNEEYNVKLYNFLNTEPVNKNQKQKDVKMSQLGALVFELCTLKTFEKSSYENELREHYYTDVFKGLVVSMIKNNSEIKKHINKILCHPTVLLQSSQWNKDRCFIESQHLSKKSSSSELSQNHSQDIPKKLETLRRKDAALQIKEQLLKEQEQKLANRERKIQLMEITLKDKLQQAEIYLSRCREGGRSISSGSSRSSSNSQFSLQSKKISYEDTDPTYVSSGDTDIFTTCTKLRINEIVKPQTFSRTMSERRIRFKISPLKDQNNAKGRKHSNILEEQLDIENDPPKAEVGQIKESNLMRRRTLHPSNNNYYNDDLVTVNTEYNPASREVSNVRWTEETKRYAFDMLRIMKSKEKEHVDMKHTFL